LAQEVGTGDGSSVQCQHNDIKAALIGGFLFY